MFALIIYNKLLVINCIYIIIIIVVGPFYLYIQYIVKIQLC